MTPRGEIEAVNIAAPIENIKAQLATSFHTRVAVFENDPANIVGVLHQRRLLAEAFAGEIDHATLRERMSDPYFIPAATPIYTQLQFFRENRQRMGLVVDEYGEIEGLVTLEDIIEELVGKFTTRQSDFGGSLSWNDDGVALADGAASLQGTQPAARPAVSPGRTAHAQRTDCRALAGHPGSGRWRCG